MITDVFPKYRIQPTVACCANCLYACDLIDRFDGHSVWCQINPPAADAKGDAVWPRIKDPVYTLCGQGKHHDGTAFDVRNAFGK